LSGANVAFVLALTRPVVRRLGPWASPRPVELVPHLLNMANNLPSGQRGLFAYGRIGSNVVNTAGFRLLQNQ
jgi:hypothetical protein